VEAAPRVVRLSSAALALLSIRLVSGLVVLGLAVAVGGRAKVALAAFALGAFAAAAFLTGDPRRRHRPRPEPDPLPARAEVQPWPSAVQSSVFPSTVGVTALGVVALFVDSTLAAVLAGVLAGMAVATAVVWLEIAALERKHGGALFGARGTEALYLDAGEVRSASSSSRS